MKPDRRSKYSSTRSYRTDFKLQLNLDLISLNIICSYIMSDNRNIRRGHLINLQNIVNILDMTDYENDVERQKRLKFINRSLEGRLVFNIRHNDLLYTHINDGDNEHPLIPPQSIIELSNAELDWVNSMITESLEYTFIYEAADKFMDISSRVKTAEFGSKAEVVKQFESLITETQTKFRRSKVESVSDMTFSLKNGVFEESIRDFHEQLNNPSSKLRFGMQGLNEMTGGGAESGRVYMLFGLPGEGKSSTLLNLAYQIKKYNTTYKTKDPTKIPCIVLLTMENTVRETVERLFNIACTPESIANFEVDQAINMLRSEGGLRLCDDSPIDIIIKYKPDRSIDTGYLYTMADDLEDEGYEIICLIQDYVKRIRSVEHHTEIRLELGAVVNEFKSFAALKDIPVISASQLNRDATKHIDEGRKVNKADLLRLIGRSNIGESMVMLENVDCSFLIAPEYDINTGQKFMGIGKIKARFKTLSPREHIYQPYVPGNGIKFVEDEDSATPAYRESMRSGDNGFNQTCRLNATPYDNHYNGGISNISDRMGRIDSEYNFFDNMNTATPSPVDLEDMVEAAYMPLINPASFIPNFDGNLITPAFICETFIPFSTL